MQTFRWEIRIEEYGRGELPASEQALIEAAVKAASGAYAPYSHFCVGAAALLANGRVVTGSNQENAAYPSGLCAERVALFSAGALYPDVPVHTLAVVAQTDGELKDRIAPCGACRQVLLETEQRYKVPMRVLLAGKEKVLVFFSAADLLPCSFSEADLKG